MRSWMQRNGVRVVWSGMAYCPVLILLYLLSAGPVDWTFERLPFDYNHPVSKCLRVVYGPAEWLMDRVPVYSWYFSRW